MMGVAVKRSWCKFLTFMITTNKWVELTSLINFYNATKLDGKQQVLEDLFLLVNIGTTNVYSFTDHQFLSQQSRHDHRSFISKLVKELLKAASTAHLILWVFHFDALLEHSTGLPMAQRNIVYFASLRRNTTK